MRFRFAPHLVRSVPETFLHIVRASGDPERRSREERQAIYGEGSSTQWKTLRKQTPEQWAERIAGHLADGVPRTFNRIMVELADCTADVVFGDAPDRGLWLLVRQSRVMMTVRVPIYFRCPIGTEPRGSVR